jgi:hypothetical protein
MALSIAAAATSQKAHAGASHFPRAIPGSGLPSASPDAGGALPGPEDARGAVGTRTV